MADQRLLAVYEAASFLFIKQGYERTQVSEIAEQAGVATGTIYNLFSGKKAILHFVVLYTFNKEYLHGDITVPIQEVETAVLTGHLARVVEELLSQMEPRTCDGKPALTFSATLSLIFDYTTNYQVAFNTINDNHTAFKDMRVVYQQYVSRLYSLIEANFRLGIERGEVRNVELPTLHIRHIVDGIVWWSMHLPYQVPDRAVDPAKAKEIALDVLRHAYLVEPGK